MLLRRYLLPEVLGTLAAVAAGWITLAATGSGWAAAWGAVLGETIGFYGPILWRDTRGHRGRARLRALRAQLTGTLVEFGLAEILDTATRPVLMYAGPLLTGDLTTGTVLGKIAADLLFYAVVIPCRLLRLRFSPPSRTAESDPRTARTPAVAAEPGPSPALQPLALGATDIAAESQ